MFATKTPWRRAVVGAAAVLFGGVMSAAASQWNEKTTLSFSEPVMVPGATLQPGTYVFKLMDSNTIRQAVEIRKQNGAEPVTIALAVAAKRMDANGNTVLKFEPTKDGEPPALKAWFFPGTLYGHEFVYPESQAKEIANRTKTLVLSVDVPGTDLEKGTLHIFDAAGNRSDWHGDPAVMNEWSAWQRTHRPTATADARHNSEASAPMIDSTGRAARVKLSDLEENPKSYVGRSISVDAEIEHVLGPRVFTIDEPNWGDLDREILVYVPSPLAAAVREDDRVTVTGEVKPFLRADVDREWGWLGVDRELEVTISKRPVLVASQIVGGDNDIAMVIDANAAEYRPVGTSGTMGTAAKTPITDMSRIARDDDHLVGRRVALSGLTVDRVAKDGGFFATKGEATVFVLPARPDGSSVQAGDTVSVNGVVLEMPDRMHDRLNAPSGANDDVYVYGTQITG
jgi:hypothetical protein